MDAHDELFYRLNDPDPHTQVMAELDLPYKIFGGNFVERWLEWNSFADALREWRAARSASSRNRARHPQLTSPARRKGAVLRAFSCVRHLFR